MCAYSVLHSTVVDVRQSYKVYTCKPQTPNAEFLWLFFGCVLTYEYTRACLSVRTNFVLFFVIFLKTNKHHNQKTNTQVVTPRAQMPALGGGYSFPKVCRRRTSTVGRRPTLWRTAFVDGADCCAAQALRCRQVCWHGCVAVGNWVYGAWRCACGPKVGGATASADGVLHKRRIGDAV